MPLDVLGFVRKWNASLLTERSAAPQHFRDLCEVLDVPHPTQADEIGASYTYEKRVAKAGTGEPGFADVWKRGWFAWEYKSKGGDLKRAYKQLNEYHESLENPPLLIVCDFTRFEVHTKFENAPPRVFAFTLDDLLVASDTATCALPPLEVLRHVFGDYNKLRPNVVAIPVTRAAASDFLRLAQRLELERALAPDRPSKEEIAHFLMRLVFCLFADSVGLLPDQAFRKLVATDRFSPIGFNKKLPSLFQSMSEPDSFFGPYNIPFFNGGLFSDNRTIRLDQADLGILNSAAHHDWSHIEPAIFGTLFERSLDDAKRSMIGAHYTSPEDILLLVEPVLMAPLLRRWQTVRQAVLDALAAEPPLNKDGKLALSLRVNRPALSLLQEWAVELTRIRILDPACGSGNFLYIALKRLLDLWHEARVFGIAHGLTLALDPIPGPGQLFGIETDFYAHEIASIVVWIGFLQWKYDHGYNEQDQPLLKVLTNIEHADAILRYDPPNDPAGKPYEPTWPEADIIIGNPPFLGGKLLRRELGDRYIDDLFRLYAGRVRAEADLVVYWFEKARAQLEAEQVTRVGLLATQGIRGGANRTVLERIQRTGAIFWAWSDRNWLLDGANVHVSMIAFHAKNRSSLKSGAPSSPTVSSSDRVGFSRHTRTAFLDEPQTLDASNPYLLNGEPVASINPDLTCGINTTTALRLSENRGICFMGTTKVGAFDIDPETARKMLDSPRNPNGRSNADVVRPWVNATDITRRPRGMYIIDFGTSMSQQEAALYELPFEYLRHHVLPKRGDNNRRGYAEKWWLHGESRPELRSAINGSPRFISTPSVSKHRLFVWLPSRTLPDHAAFAFTRPDDYFFGVLHSRAHELWARAQGTQLREVESGFRYTPDSTFDTYPFPWPPNHEPKEGPEAVKVEAIAEAARTLVQLRDAWLNPPNTSEADLKKRTLTNLYNARPTWLADAHSALDEAVLPHTVGPPLSPPPRSSAACWPSTTSAPPPSRRPPTYRPLPGAQKLSSPPNRRKRTIPNEDAPFRHPKKVRIHSLQPGIIEVAEH